MYISEQLPPHLLNTTLELFTNEQNKIQSEDLLIPLMDDSVKCPPVLQTVYNEFLTVLKKWDIISDGDLLGFLYQKIETELNKKTKGQFFTPLDIVDHIIEDSLQNISDFDTIRTLKFLDPACGSGHFLILLFKKLQCIYVQNNIPSQQAAIEIIKNNLYGFDIDSLAIKIARFNISQIASVPEENISNIMCRNFILKDSLQFDQPIIPENNYDIIIGNPPWGSTLTKDEKKYYRKAYSSAKSGINTFTLFIERSLELLKEKGALAFLVPEALLNIKAHQNCRKYILENSKISNITLWGDQFEDVYSPAISFLISKSSALIKQNTFKLCSRTNSKKNNDLIINQSSLQQSYQNIININYSSQTQDILSHINSQECYYLENRAQFFLGIVTGNNTRHVQTTQTEEYPDRILVGKDVTPYQINYSGHTFSFNPKKLQQTAPKHLYEQKNKILYKFIGKRLTFAIDREGYYMLNSVNGFIPDMENVSSEAMLAILNSTLMQYFYEKKFFTLKTLRGNLEKLPIRKLSSDAEGLLSDLSNQMMNSQSLSENQHLQENIDDIVFSQYDINDKQAYYIWDAYNNERAQMFLPGT
ncbi:MAG: N-6 DNA methylase [Spirochaetes bacterium]|jgi:tRNA1(Val) A37 N6-methylase TrmN6|nr:N-6 DNA methylase [Spirochaetota bacterium]